MSSRIVGFILIPIYTKHIPVASYGMYGLLISTSAVLISIFGLSLYQAFFRWYCDKRYLDKQKSLFYTSTVFLILVAAIMLVLITLFSKQISTLLFQTPDSYYLIILMALTSCLELFMQIPNNLLRVQEKAVLFTTQNIIKLSVSMVLTIYFVVFLKRQVEGIFEALFISQIVSMLYLSKYIFENLEMKLEKSLLRDMLIFSLPLALSSISVQALPIIDRYSLKFLSNISNVGLYTLGSNMANTLYGIIWASLWMALSPLIFRKMDEPDNHRFYSKIMTYSTFGFMFCVLGMSFFGKEVIKVLAHDNTYWDAYKIIPFLSFVGLFQAMRDVAMTGLHVVRRSKVTATIITIMAVVNLGFNFVFVPIFGLVGTAIASLTTQSIYLLIIYHYSQKYYPIPYEVAKLTKMIVIAIVFSLIAFFINDYNLLIRLSVKTLLIFIFPIILYFWNFYEEVEILALKNFWLKWKSPGRWKENLMQIKI